METPLKTFHVFHPVGGGLNPKGSLDMDYEFVITIQSENLIRAYYQAQSSINRDYAKLNVRSTIAGDIISADDNVHMITLAGFKRVPKARALYGKIRKLEQRLQSRPMTEELLNQLLDEV